ncbi:MAG: Asp23/Gls24 family envelope stress response protein [Clostridia bacterium]|nr:Asp23/Gls24 family envelope stress response protein [Clostridia bacterium]MBQ3057352.1 Asp23/Gls24 family envelope stress response protein [Clostridia bacterium]
MADNATKLSINTEVLRKMAEIATLEVEGVASIAKKNYDLKDAVKAKGPFQGIKIESVNGALEIGIYITVKKDAKVKEVADKVQQNVKDKIQTMTNTAVTRVNVDISDIVFGDEPVEE